jgi:hypothetical protein
MKKKRVTDTLLVLMRKLADQDPAKFRKFMAMVDEQVRSVEKIPTK